MLRISMENSKGVEKKLKSQGGMPNFEGKNADFHEGQCKKKNEKIPGGGVMIISTGNPGGQLSKN